MLLYKLESELIDSTSGLGIHAIDRLMIRFVICKFLFKHMGGGSFSWVHIQRYMVDNYSYQTCGR